MKHYPKLPEEPPRPPRKPTYEQVWRLEALGLPVPATRREAFDALREARRAS